MENPQLDFFGLNNGKNTGTAYAASYINSAAGETRFVETDDFLGSIWLNGEEIYDGFVLNAPRKSIAKFGSMVDLRINAADFTPPWTDLAGNVEKLESNRPQIKVTEQAQDLYFDALSKEVAEGKVKPTFYPLWVQQCEICTQYKALLIHLTV